MSFWLVSFAINVLMSIDLRAAKGRLRLNEPEGEDCCGCFKIRALVIERDWEMFLIWYEPTDLIARIFPIQRAHFPNRKPFKDTRGQFEADECPLQPLKAFQTCVHASHLKGFAYQPPIIIYQKSSHRTRLFLPSNFSERTGMTRLNS